MCRQKEENNREKITCGFSYWSEEKRGGLLFLCPSHSSLCSFALSALFIGLIFFSMLCSSFSLWCTFNVELILTAHFSISMERAVGTRIALQWQGNSRYRGGGGCGDEDEVRGFHCSWLTTDSFLFFFLFFLFWSTVYFRMCFISGSIIHPSLAIHFSAQLLQAPPLLFPHFSLIPFTVAGICVHFFQPTELHVWHFCWSKKHVKNKGQENTGRGTPKTTIVCLYLYKLSKYCTYHYI